MGAEAAPYGLAVANFAKPGGGIVVDGIAEADLQEEGQVVGYFVGAIGQEVFGSVLAGMQAAAVIIIVVAFAVEVVVIVPPFGKFKKLPFGVVVAGVDVVEGAVGAQAEAEAWVYFIGQGKLSDGHATEIIEPEGVDRCGIGTQGEGCSKIFHQSAAGGSAALRFGLFLRQGGGRKQKEGE